MNDEEILERARAIVRARHLHRGAAKVIREPATTREVLSIELAGDHNECFVVLYLDTRHRLIEFRREFYGTVDGASVHPRVIVRRALELGAAACVVAHNHPSGVAEPSRSDRALTERLCDALALIDVRLLDHFVVGDAADEIVSFAERGWL